MNYKLLITGIVAAGMAIVGAAIYVGVALRDGEVSDNAYDAGLTYDAAAKKRVELGWRVELPRTSPPGAGHVRIGVFDRSGQAVKGAAVQLTLDRPGGRSSKTYRCEESEGRYAAPVLLDETGYWKAKVRVDWKGDSLTFDQWIFVPEENKR